VFVGTWSFSTGEDEPEQIELLTELSALYLSRLRYASFGNLICVRVQVHVQLGSAIFSFTTNTKLEEHECRFLIAF